MQGEDGDWRDISDILISSNIGFGKNQPFMFVSVNIIKQLFNSKEYWANKTLTTASSDPTDVSFGKTFSTTKPDIISGTTRIAIDTYGKTRDLVIAKINDTGDSLIELQIANGMYKTKSLPLSSIFSMTATGILDPYGMPVFVIDWMPSNVLPYSVQGMIGERYTQKIIPEPYSDSTPLSSLYVDLKYQGPGHLPELEMIYGTTSDIFRFIAFAIGEYDPTSVGPSADMLIDYPLHYVNGVPKPELAESYSLSDIQEFAKTKQILQWDGGEIQTKFRPEINCWDAINYIADVTLRVPFFYDKAYLVSYENAPLGNLSTNGTYLSNLIIDYGLFPDYIYPNYTLSGWSPMNTGDIFFVESDRRFYIVLDGTQSPPLYTDANLETTLGIAVNADQGEKNVIQQQTVSAENFEWTSFISDYPTRNEGASIQSHYPDMSESGIEGSDLTLELSKGRKYQTKLCAMHKIVDNYRPKNMIRYNISEVTLDPNMPPIYTTYGSATAFDTALANGTLPLVDGRVIGIITKHPSGLLKSEEYLIWNAASNSWLNYPRSSFRRAKYSPYSKVRIIEDRQNAITLDEAPLAYTNLIYPSCVTELTWGWPEFQDAEGQLDVVDGMASGATQEGDGDINISDKWSSKLSIGNQPLSQIDEDFTDFSGIAIVKNRTAEVYEIRGYGPSLIDPNVTGLQTRFTSTGAIEAGINPITNIATVRLDQDGINIAQGGIVISQAGIQMLIPVGPDTIYDENSIIFRTFGRLNEANILRIGGRAYSNSAEIYMQTRDGVISPGGSGTKLFLGSEDYNFSKNTINYVSLAGASSGMEYQNVAGNWGGHEGSISNTIQITGNTWSGRLYWGGDRSFVNTNNLFRRFRVRLTFPNTSAIYNSGDVIKCTGSVLFSSLRSAGFNTDISPYSGVSNDPFRCRFRIVFTNGSTYDIVSPVNPPWQSSAGWINTPMSLPSDIIAPANNVQISYVEILTGMTLGNWTNLLGSEEVASRVDVNITFTTISGVDAKGLGLSSKGLSFGVEIENDENEGLWSWGGTPFSFPQQQPDFYEKFPSGLLIQGGVDSGVANSNQRVSFPISFVAPPGSGLNRPYTIQLTKNTVTQNTSAATVNIWNVDLTGFNYQRDASNTGNWLAIGRWF